MATCRGNCTSTCGSSSSGTTKACNTNCTGYCGGACAIGCSGACGGVCKGNCGGGCGSVCSGGCMSSCTTGCKGGCKGSCNTSCTAACAHSGCTTTCNTGCKGSCSGSCSGKCTGCKGSCSGSCKGSCSSGCTGCKGSCSSGCRGSCGGSSCTATCASSCNNSTGSSGGCGSCSSNCASGCYGSSGGGCGSCSSGCSSGCTGTGCAGGCNDACATCSGSCSGQCSSGCTGSCSGGCSTGCSGNCGSGCTGCSGSCMDGCYNGCTGGCATICVGSCYSGCTGCTGTCKGGCLGGCGKSCTNSAQGSFNIYLEPTGSVWTNKVTVYWDAYNNNKDVSSYEIDRGDLIIHNTSELSAMMKYYDDTTKWGGVGIDYSQYYRGYAINSESKIIANTNPTPTVWLEDLLPPTKLRYLPDLSKYINSDGEMQITKQLSISWNHSTTKTKTGYIVDAFAENNSRGFIKLGVTQSSYNVISLIDVYDEANNIDYRAEGPKAITIEVSTLREPQLGNYPTESSPISLTKLRYVPYPTQKYGKSLNLNAPILYSIDDETSELIEQPQGTNQLEYTPNTPMTFNWSPYPDDHYGYYDAYRLYQIVYSDDGSYNISYKRLLAQVDKDYTSYTLPKLDEDIFIRGKIYGIAVVAYHTKYDSEGPLSNIIRVGLIKNIPISPYIISPHSDVNYSSSARPHIVFGLPNLINEISSDDLVRVNSLSDILDKILLGSTIINKSDSESMDYWNTIKVFNNHRLSEDNSKIIDYLLTNHNSISSEISKFINTSVTHSVGLLNTSTIFDFVSSHSDTVENSIGNVVINNTEYEVMSDGSITINDKKYSMSSKGSIIINDVSYYPSYDISVYDDSSISDLLGLLALDLINQLSISITNIRIRNNIDDKWVYMTSTPNAWSILVNDITDKSIITFKYPFDTCKDYPEGMLMTDIGYIIELYSPKYGWGCNTPCFCNLYYYNKNILEDTTGSFTSPELTIGELKSLLELVTQYHKNLLSDDYDISDVIVPTSGEYLKRSTIVAMMTHIVKISEYVGLTPDYSDVDIDNLARGLSRVLYGHNTPVTSVRHKSTDWIVDGSCTAHLYRSGYELTSIRKIVQELLSYLKSLI